LRIAYGRVAARGRFNRLLRWGEWFKVQRLLWSNPRVPGERDETFCSVLWGQTLEAAKAHGLEMPPEGAQPSEGFLQDLLQFLIENWEVILEIILSLIALF